MITNLTSPQREFDVVMAITPLGSTTPVTSLAAGFPGLPLPYLINGNASVVAQLGIDASCGASGCPQAGVYQITITVSDHDNPALTPGVATFNFIVAANTGTTTQNKVTAANSMRLTIAGGNSKTVYAGIAPVNLGDCGPGVTCLSPGCTGCLTLMLFVSGAPVTVTDGTNSLTLASGDAAAMAVLKANTTTITNLDPINPAVVDVGIIN
jgi:hypothetical protein